jgi:asparagine synthetase B (glutamine-hydrolysing)
LNNVYDFAPGRVYFSNSKKISQLESHRYWKYRLGENRITSRTEKDFSDLWKKQLKIYVDKVKERSAACYIPISGGLDSRLIVNEFDKYGVNIYGMTFGFGLDNYETKIATKVVNALKNKINYQLQYLNEENLNVLNSCGITCNLVTTAHAGEMYLHPWSRVKKEAVFYVPGYTGDFISGGHLRQRMLNWSSKKEVIDYILRFRSTPMTKQLYKENHPLIQKLRKLLAENIDIEDNDYCSAYLRWEVENRQRRYIMRSALEDKASSGYTLFPFFDNEIIDFFLNTPNNQLLNQKLYINTALDYLFENNQILKKIKRANPTRKIRKVGNPFYEEYSNKLISLFKNQFKKHQQNQLNWDKNIKWFEVYNFLRFKNQDINQILNLSSLKNDARYLRFLNTIYRVQQELINND